MQKPPVDPKIAALLSAVFAILGVFEVFARLDMSADQVAVLLGSIGALLTTARAMLLARAHRKAAGSTTSANGGYSADRSVDPARIRPPKGGDAVIGPRQ